MSYKNLDGHGTCQCCGKEKIWCYTLNEIYKVDGIEKVCFDCQAYISTGAQLSYGEKQDWQITRVKCLLLNVKSNSQKEKLLGKPKKKIFYKLRKLLIEIIE